MIVFRFASAEALVPSFSMRSTMSSTTVSVWLKVASACWATEYVRFSVAVCALFNHSNRDRYPSTAVRAIRLAQTSRISNVRARDNDIAVNGVRVQRLYRNDNIGYPW